MMIFMVRVFDNMYSVCMLQVGGLGVNNYHYDGESQDKPNMVNQLYSWQRAGGTVRPLLATLLAH